MIEQRSQVDAYCTACKRDVVLEDGSRACPHCNQEVHPLSLPSVPEEHRTDAVIARMTAEPIAPVVTVLKPPSRTVEPSKAAAPADPVTLPENMLDWLEDTKSRRDRLVREEAEVLEELKRIRGARRLLDAVLARVAEPSEPATAPTLEVKTVPVKPPAAPPLPIAAPTTNGHGRIKLGPGHPDYVPEDGAPKPWSKAHERCVNCGTTERKHAEKGRCSACAQYLRSHGVERPESLWKGTQPS